MVSSCTPRIHPGEKTKRPESEKQTPKVSDPFKYIYFLLENGKKPLAISNLKHLLSNPDYTCKAAFDLAILDGGKREYLDILTDDSCRRNAPVYTKAIKKLLYWQGQARKWKTKNKEAQLEIEAWREETESLEKELARLRFELQKMEEIRKDTEKWRLQ